MIRILCVLLMFSFSLLAKDEAKTEHKVGADLADSLYDADGKKVELPKIKERRDIVLFFIMTTNRYSSMAIPKMVAYHKKKYKRGKFDVILVPFDTDKNAVMKFMKDNKVSFPAVDYNKVAGLMKLYNTRGAAPSIAVVDADGKTLFSGNAVKEFGAAQKVMSRRK